MWELVDLGNAWNLADRRTCIASLFSSCQGRCSGQFDKTFQSEFEQFSHKANWVQCQSHIYYQCAFVALLHKLLNSCEVHCWWSYGTTLTAQFWTFIELSLVLHYRIRTSRPLKHTVFNTYQRGKDGGGLHCCLRETRNSLLFTYRYRRQLRTHT